MQHKDNYHKRAVSSLHQISNNGEKYSGNEIKLSILHKKIFDIENPKSKTTPEDGSGRLGKASQWRFGLREIDDSLPWGGLGVGLHEIQPEDHRDTGAAIAFALALISRLTPDALKAENAGNLGAPRPLLWCAPAETAREFGRPYGPGLASLGLDPNHIIFVNAEHRQDVAWAMEEGVKSQSVLAVIGVLPNLAPVPARRLALAAKTYGTPCLAIEAHDAPGLGPASSRWRAAGNASPAPPFDARAPGFPAWRIVLERCRHGMEQRHWNVEWRPDAHRFNLAAQLSAGAEALAPGASQSAGKLHRLSR